MGAVSAEAGEGAREKLPTLAAVATRTRKRQSQTDTDIKQMGS